MGFHYAGQAGLKLLTSSNPPALASQNAGITSVSHQAQATLYTFDCKFFLSHINNFHNKEPLQFFIQLILPAYSWSVRNTEDTGYMGGVVPQDFFFLNNEVCCENLLMLLKSVVE